MFAGAVKIPSLKPSVLDLNPRRLNVDCRLLYALISYSRPALPKNPIRLVSVIPFCTYDDVPVGRKLSREELNPASTGQL